MPIIVASVGLVVVAAFCISSLSQRRSVARLSATLVQAHDKNRIKRIDFPSVAGLPAPVARYFRLVLREGQTYSRGSLSPAR
jgi:hypothetical protein